MTLTQLARQMRADLERTNRPQEQIITHDSLPEPFQLIYRYGPQRAQVQLVTIIWCRQPSKALQDELWTAFDAPWTVEPTFTYQNGYGIMRLTWPTPTPPQPVQGILFDSLPGESRAGAYYSAT